MLNKLLIATAVAIGIGGSAYAQQTTTGVGTSTAAQTLTSVPTNATTVTNWYKQNVYDPSDNKIGEIADVLIDKDGKIEVFMVSVGGFLGVGEKDVAAAVQRGPRHPEGRQMVPDHERHQGLLEERVGLQVRPGQSHLGACLTSESQHTIACPAVHSAGHFFTASGVHGFRLISAEERDAIDRCRRWLLCAHSRNRGSSSRRAQQRFAACSRVW
jgi:hypothetical protein